MSDLAKRLSNVGTSLQQSMPEFLQQETEVTGTEGMIDYIRPPFVKIVQKTSSSELKEQYKEGTVLLVPGNTPILTIEQQENGEKLYFTPLLFYPEYCVFNPVEWKNTEPMIAERSFDRNSIIAKKALDANLRNEPCLDVHGNQIVMRGKPLYKTYQECLNFIVTIHNTEAKEVCDYCVMSFRGGENGTGARLAMLINARKKPIYAGVYEAGVSLHQDPYEGHSGFDPNNPSDVSPWVTDAEEYESYRDSHVQLLEILKNKKLATEYDGRPVVVNDDVIDAEFVGEEGMPVDGAEM